MDIEKMTLEELEEAKKNIDKHIKDKKEKERDTKELRVISKIEKLKKYENLILSLLEHDCKSCGEGGYYEGLNGWSEDFRKYDCAKCMMKEISNGYHGGRFDFQFRVHIWEVK